MRLSLSSAALPAADFAELVDACLRRGLAGVELRAGDGHGVAIEQRPPDRDATLAYAATAGIAITGFRTHATDDPHHLLRLAVWLNAPVVIDGASAVAKRIDGALRLRHAGAEAAVAVRGTEAVRDAVDVAAAGLAIAWDADPSAAPVARQAEALLGDCPAALRHVRLIGGGPEVALQEGKGVGALMGQLALGGFEGELVLAPSSPRYRVAWQTWLGRRGGWGCGSKAEAAVLPLASASVAEGSRR